MPFHPLTNIEKNEYYKNEPRFSGVYSRNNLQKIIKKGAYVINLDEYANIGTHWIALFVKPKFINLLFLKKLKHLLVIKILKQIYLDYKHMIQLCVVIFV